MKENIAYFFLLALLMLSGFTNTLAQKKQFPPLISSYESNNMNTRESSEVIPFEASPELLARIPELSKELLGLEESRNFYQYIYRFENTGNTRLKINFSEWEFVHSPFTYFLQDFSFEINAGEIKEIKFVANGKPELIETPVNAGVWMVPSNENNSVKKWVFSGIGKAFFYKPSFYSHSEKVE